MTRGRRGLLALRRRALPSPPPSRFIPALSETTPNNSALYSWSRPRSEYGEMVVFDLLFCDQSTRTLPVRSDLAIRETTSAGRAFASSSAANRAHSEACPLLIGWSIGTYRCRPLLPLVATVTR